MILKEFNETHVISTPINIHNKHRMKPLFRLQTAERASHRRKKDFRENCTPVHTS